MFTFTEKKKSELKASFVKTLKLSLRIILLVATDIVIYKAVTTSLGYDTKCKSYSSNGTAALKDLSTKGRRLKGLGYLTYVSAYNSSLAHLAKVILIVRSLFN